MDTVERFSHYMYMGMVLKLKCLSVILAARSQFIPPSFREINLNSESIAHVAIVR